MNMGRPQKFDPFWSLAGGRGLQVDAMDPVQIWINPPGIRKIWDKHADKTAKKGGGGDTRRHPRVPTAEPPRLEKTQLKKKVRICKV